ncbi:MAG: AMP-binding protein [bacterium]
MSVDSKYLPLESVYRWERDRPDGVFMTQPMGGGELRTFTWKETLDQARRMAAYLVAQGFEPGSSIGILSKNCAWFILSDLAIWMAGHRSVALYPTIDAKAASYVLTHSEVKLLFVGKLDIWEELAAGVPEDLPCVSYPLSPPGDFPTWDDIVADTKPVEGSPTRSPEETSLLIYTSGSTGVPKGAEITFGNMGVAMRGVGDYFQLGPVDRALSYLPLAHAYERGALEANALYHGFQVFFAESLETFLQDLQRARPTLFFSVPRLYLKFQLGVFSKVPEKKLKRLLKIPILRGIVRRKILRGLGLGDARYAISGSAPIPASLIQWYRDLGLELLEAYGMTENFCVSHISFPGRARVGYVGNTWPGVECRLSEEGEVLVRTDANMKGYFKQPELTAEMFTEDGFLRTGDLGELDDQDRLRITGRIKELFKTSKGKYIAPVPVENLLNASPLIEQSCVSGRGHPQPYALVLLDEELHKRLGSDAASVERLTRELGTLRDQVNRELATYEQLQLLVVVKDRWLIENGFLTPTMKIKRSVLEETYEPFVQGWYDSGDRVIWQERPGA